jgi:ECF transporter S component (folate family)
MKISSRVITNMGFLIALSIILTRIASIRIAIGGVEGIRIGLGKFPVVLGGIIFGPLAGGIIGGFSDLLGYIINPIGAYMPHFTLTSALTGIIPVVILRLFTRSEEIKTIELGFSITIGHIITSLIMIPYFLHNIFGIPWVVLMPARMIAAPFNILIYTYIIKILLKKNNIMAHFR